jgi:hypothetical protein
LVRCWYGVEVGGVVWGGGHFVWWCCVVWRYVCSVFYGVWGGVR